MTMKHATILVSSISALLAVAACAVPSEEPGEAKLGSTAQALCRIGTCDSPDPGSSGGMTSGGVLDPGDDPPPPPPPKWPGASGGLTSSGVLDPTDPLEFQCVSSAKLCTDPDYVWLSCNKARTECVCMQGCGGGGGWPYGTLNPCPYYARNYTCSPAGSCRCSS